MSAPARTVSAVDRIAADVRQLVKPIYMAHRSTIITHRPLMDSLRASAAVLSSGARGPERRPAPASRPPGRNVIDLAATMLDIDNGIAGWHGRLYLPSPPAFVYDCPHHSCRELLIGGYRGPLCRRAGRHRTDWHKTVLGQLADAAPKLDAPRAEWLAVEVHDWWHDAAVGSGWNPADLLKLR